MNFTLLVALAGVLATSHADSVTVPHSKRVARGAPLYGAAKLVARGLFAAPAVVAPAIKKTPVVYTTRVAVVTPVIKTKPVVYTSMITVAKPVIKTTPVVYTPRVAIATPVIKTTPVIYKYATPVRVSHGISHRTSVVVAAPAKVQKVVATPVTYSTSIVRPIVAPVIKTVPVYYARPSHVSHSFQGSHVVYRAAPVYKVKTVHISPVYLKT